MNQRKILISNLLLITILTTFTLVSMVNAQGQFTIQQLTDNEVRDWNPFISGNIVAWDAPNSEGYREIYYYDISNPAEGIQQLTNNDYNDNSPRIDSSIIVWMGKPGEGTDVELFMYDISNPMDGITRITDNDLDDIGVQIDSGIIAWYSREGDGIYDSYEICMYDTAHPEDGVQQITDNDYRDENPEIDSGIIVWSGDPKIGEGYTWEIYMYDTVHPEDGIQQVTDNTYLEYYPKIDAGIITYHAIKGPWPLQPEIFYYDLLTQEEIQITETPYISDSYPSIKNGIISWYRSDSYSSYSLHVYDVSTGETTTITSGVGQLAGPMYGNRVYDGFVLWGKHESGVSKLYTYDVSVDESTQIVSSNYLIMGAQTNGQVVSWNSFVDTDEEIFLAFAPVVVDIDVKPNTYPNDINLKSKGKIPVAILTTQTLDSTTVDPDTIEFAGATPIHWDWKDIDADGDIDLILQFKTQEVSLLVDDTKATLTGNLFSGKSIVGVDSVNVRD